MMAPALALVVLLIAAMTAASPAHAEWAIDLFGGASWTRSTDLDVSGRDDAGLSAGATLFDIETDTGFTAGGRVGYWFESAPFLGLGFDAFYFSIPVPSQTVNASSTFSGSLRDKAITFTLSGQANIPDVDLPSAAFSPQLMLRWPLLVSADAPKGRLQPYLGGGPAWAFTLDSDDLSLVFGGLARAGLAIQVFRHLALFVEYRYSFFPGFELKNRGLTYEADLDTHHAVIGLSFRF